MRYIFFIILIFSISGCSEKGGTPSGILGREKMQAVLWDMIRADTFTEQFIKRDSSKNVLMENRKLQDAIFSIHKVTRSEYLKSYDYYITHTDLIRVVLDSMYAKAQRDRTILFMQNVEAQPIEKFSMLASGRPDGLFKYAYNSFIYSTKK